MAGARKGEKWLTAVEVVRATDGDHHDGAGLVYRVRGASKSWVFRYTSPRTKKRREMGLRVVGSAATPKSAGAFITAARNKHDEARAVLNRGLDPIDEREREEAAEREAHAAAKSALRSEQLTLARVARGYYERNIEPVRSTKHALQWISSLERHVPADIWNAPIAQIEPAALLDALSDLRHGSPAKGIAAVPETAMRIRQRLDAIYDDAVIRKIVGVNPVKVLRRALSGERTRSNFKSLAYRDVPGLYALLAVDEGIAARALAFTILTAARTGETLGMRWSELDEIESTWTVPAERMKAGETHIVYLAEPALAIVQSMRGLDAEYVFPSMHAKGGPMSNMAMLSVLKRLGVAGEATVHGMRASFSTWAYETNAARRDAIEATLAHKERDRVAAAYNRAQFTEERRTLLARWAAFVTSTTRGTEDGGNVIELRRQA